MTPTVVLVNRCTAELPFALDEVVEAGTELIGHLAGPWKVQAELHWIKPTTAIPPEWWPLFLVDHSNQPGTVAYHAFDAQSPWGLTGIGTAQQYGLDPVLAVFHELVEMLVNPCTDDTIREYGALYLLKEPVDPVQGTAFTARNGLSLPNFVYPAWYGQSNPPGLEPTRLDHLGVVTTPGTLLPGGYVSEWSPETGWTQRWADAQAQQTVERKLAEPLSRLARAQA